MLLALNFYKIVELLFNLLFSASMDTTYHVLRKDYHVGLDIDTLKPISLQLALKCTQCSDINTLPLNLRDLHEPQAVNHTHTVCENPATIRVTKNTEGTTIVGIPVTYNLNEKEFVDTQVTWAAVSFLNF